MADPIDYNDEERNVASATEAMRRRGRDPGDVNRDLAVVRREERVRRAAPQVALHGGRGLEPGVHPVLLTHPALIDEAGHA